MYYSRNLCFVSTEDTVLVTHHFKGMVLDLENVSKKIGCELYCSLASVAGIWLSSTTRNSPLIQVTSHWAEVITQPMLLAPYKTKAPTVSIELTELTALRSKGTRSQHCYGNSPHGLP